MKETDAQILYLKLVSNSNFDTWFLNQSNKCDCYETMLNITKREIYIKDNSYLIPNSVNAFTQSMGEAKEVAALVLEHYGWTNSELKLFSINTDKQTKQTKESIMAQLTKIHTTHYIDDTPVQDYKLTQLHDLMMIVEKEIKKLHKINTPSKSVKKEIQQRKKVLAFIVKEADSR